MNTLRSDFSLSVLQTEEPGEAVAHSSLGESKYGSALQLLPPPNSVASPTDLRTTFEECHRTLENKSYYTTTSDCGDNPTNESVFCGIYYALIDDALGCNALGNNLNDSMDDVKEFLANGPHSARAERDIRDYLLRLYLIVEQVYEALKPIGVHEKCINATDGMRAMRDVKQWANFFKHPGAFLWCHAPKYCISSSHEQADLVRSDFLIDQDAVNFYYTMDAKRHGELHKKISNATEVVVVFPDLVTLTSRFCQGIDDFCQTISSPLFRDVLKNKSTIDDYFVDAAHF